jgi:ankyrin repeat protein
VAIGQHITREKRVTRVALRTFITAAALAGAALFAMPASAQLYSEGSLFLKAVEDHDRDKIVEMLAAPGSTVVNARDITSGRSAMHIVVEQRDTEWMGFLHGQRINVNLADNRGVTPLMLAVQIGFIEGVERLISYGARVDVTNSSGETPLMYAVHGRNNDLMRVLLQAGANPDRRDNSGRSARDYARLRGASDQTNDIITRYERPANQREGAATYGPSF